MEGRVATAMKICPNSVLIIQTVQQPFLRMYQESWHYKLIKYLDGKQ